MAINRLKQLWQVDKAAFGVVVTMPSVQTMQVLAHAGFDWLLIDMEHGPIDLASAHALIVATAGTPTVPLVRIAANVPWLAKPLLDAGALGICVPMIRTRRDAETAVAAVRYPPQGERMWAPLYAALRWDLPMPRYLEVANEEVLSILTLEHGDAARKIDDIMSVPGIDLALVGAFDLATSLGHHGHVEHSEVQAAIKEIEAGILRSKAVLGGIALSADEANRMIDRGYRVLALGFDWMLMQRGAADVLRGLKR